MAIDKGKTLDQLMAEIQADLQAEQQRQASRPRLSLPDIPTGQAPTTQEQQEMIDKYLNAKSPLSSFLGNTLNTISFPLNYGVLQPLGQYTDFGRWTDPNKDFLDKVAFNPFSKANELLAEGWEKDGFFGAVGELAEKGKTGGDVVAGLSSTLGYGLSRAIGSDTEEDKAFDLKYWQERQKKFKEENKAAYYGGGFGVEVFGDPLNALTFGGASAVKAGARAALKEANKVAKSAGVSGKFKTVEDAVDAVYNKTVDKYTKMQPQTKALQTPASQTVTKNIDAEINRIKQAAIKKGIDPDKAQKLATQAVKSSEEPAQVVSRIDRLATEARQRAIAQIDNAARSARAKAQNRLISLDIPLTNKTVGLVNKPAFMARTADKVGERAVSVVANLTKLLEPPSANTPEALASAARVAEDRMSELLQTRYGVTKAEDLTIDAIRDLEDLFESSQRRTKELGFQTKVDEELIPEMKVAKVEDALRNVDPKVVQAIDNLLGQGYKIDEVDQIIGDARTAYNIDKDTLEILPELIRAEAKQLGMPTITPTPKPVPKSIINKFDQLFAISEDLGLESRTYEKAFTDLVDEFNSGKITKEDLLKRVSEDLKSTKQLLKENQVSAKSTAKPKAPKQPVVKEEPITEARVQTPSNQKPIDNVPFTKGENIYTSPSVTQDVAKVVEKWKNMLNIKGRMVLLAVDENKLKSFYDLTIPLRDAIKNKSVKDVEYYNELLSALKEARSQMTRETSGLQLTLKNGDVIVIYRDVPDKQRMLSTISHELGHAVMDSAYKSAPENIRKAIDAEFKKFLVESKGKSAKQVLEKLMNFPRFQELEKDPFRDLSLPMDEAFSKQFREYLISKDEWFAEQVAKWALSSKKPMSVVEKFFYDVAQKLKQFFQANKQFLPTKTMADWLNGLEKTAKQSIQPATEPLDMKFAKSELDSKTVPNETPQVKQKTTEPSNVITPEKKKYFEMLRSTLQPTGIPQVVQGMDKEFVKQMEQVAKRLEEMKPIRILDDQKQLKRKELALTPVLDAEGKAKKITVPVQKVQTKKVKGETVYVTSGRDYVPFEKLRKMPEFVQDMGGNTPIGRWYRSTLLSRVFSARSLGLGDTFVNSYGDLIQQAKTMKAGELNFMQRDLVKLSKIAEGLTNDELLAAQYLVENRFPKAFSDAQIETLKKNEKLGELVDTIKNLMAYVGKEEQAAGLLGKLRDDYFPHVMKFNNTKWDDFVKKYEDDKDLGGLIGKSQSNSFTKQRTGLPTLAELDDALASLDAKLKDATNEKAIKGLSGKIKELEEMFNRNTLQAVASRVYTSARSRAMRQLYTQMRKDRLLRYTVPSLKPEDFVRITREEADALGFPKLREGASVLYIQKDLMDALKRTEDIFTDDRLTEGIKTIDDVMKIWRLSTTVMIPKHYVNNLIGNVFNNMLAGVNPTEYKNAAKVLSDMRKGKLSASDQELVKQAYRDGVIGQGHNVEFDIFADPAKIKTWAQRTNEKIRSWGYTRALMYAGQWIDDTSRLALYMDSLKKTRSPKIAADRVREYLFNYHEVTHADKLVRSLLMPFWLWTKNNLPLQMKNLFTNPRVYVLAENIRRATFDDQDFADDPEFIREKYIQNFLGQKVPFSLPMYDVNKIEGFTGTLSNFASDLGPIPFRVPIELAANKEFFSNAKIYKEGKMNEDEKTASIVAYLTKAFGGQVGSWVVDTYKKVIKDDKLTPEEQIARITSSYLYGMPYYEK